jgi:hypothetical protein
MNKPVKMRLYDWFWNWAMPLSPQEIQAVNQQIATDKEYQRLFALEAERIAADIAKTTAETALIEEANAKERGDALPWKLIGIAEFALQLRLGDEPAGQKTNIKTFANLEESPSGRRRALFNSVRADTNSILNISHDGVKRFIESRPTYSLYLTPWLNGHLDNKQLGKVNSDYVVDSVFISLRFSPGAKTS